MENISKNHLQYIIKNIPAHHIKKITYHHAAILHSKRSNNNETRWYGERNKIQMLYLPARIHFSWRCKQSFNTIRHGRIQTAHSSTNRTLYILQRMWLSSDRKMRWPKMQRIWKTVCGSWLWISSLFFNTNKLEST